MTHMTDTHTHTQVRAQPLTHLLVAAEAALAQRAAAVGAALLLEKPHHVRGCLCLLGVVERGLTRLGARMRCFVRWWRARHDERSEE
jgi:hypothetical protein